MAKGNTAVVAFNGGEIGREVIQRTSLEIYPHTASLLENWLTETAGPMSMRMGLAFKNAIAGHPTARLRRFTFSAEQVNLCICTGNALRIADADGNILVRNAVTATVANPTFATLAGWTDISEAGATVASLAPGLALESNGVAIAGVRQQITTASPGVRHSIVINVARGPVLFRVGNTASGDEIVSEQTLRTGQHSLAFTPALASFWIDVYSTDDVFRLVSSVSIAAAGDLVLDTPWPQDALQDLRFQQSADVLYVGSGRGGIHRLERRGVNSWSLCQANITDGPFLTLNVDKRFSIAPSALIGNITLTANRALFKPGHFGALWKITHTGQAVNATVAGADQWTDPIKVTGVGSADRSWYYTIAGSFVGTVHVQRSFGNTTSWKTVPGASSLTGPATDGFTDTFDNQIVYYRMGFPAGSYTSGAADIAITYAAGSTTGIARVIGYVSPTVLDAEVVEQFGGIGQVTQWYEGAWSDAGYWPKALAIDDGRMIAGSIADLFWASSSAAYESFAPGPDAADAISRAVATGDMARIQWFVSLERLVAGTAGAVSVIKASQLDEVITPTNLTVKDADTIGCANVEPAKIDRQAVFIDKSRWRAHEVAQNERGGYSVKPLMRLHRRLGKGGITHIAVQRQPDTRVFMIRGDGQCLVLLYDAAENAIGWGRLITDGAFESVEVLPGEGEDRVFFWVARTVNGATVRYLEKLDGGYVETMLEANPVDSYVRYDGVPITVMTGLGHLEGRTVVVWADGAMMGDLVVSGGQITLRRAASHVVAGLGYEARYTSSKLVYAAQGGTAHAQYKRPLRVAFMLANTKPGAVEYGVGFDKPMDRLGDRLLTTAWDAASDLVSGDTDSFPMPGGFDRDPRLCLRASSRGGPATVQGLVLGLQTNDKIG